MAKDMYQKRKERQETKENETSDDKKTNINWFPGHMVKAKKEIQNNLSLVDIVIEIIDARIPLSSQNPDFDILLTNKPRIIALNKSDISDSSINKLWLNHFKNTGHNAVLISCSTGQNINTVLTLAYETCHDILEKSASKGRIGRPLRALVVGIPNCGKSSFINKVAGKSVAVTGNKPGVTREKKWIKTKYNIELMDTPGILWPKFDSPSVGLNLAFTGAIKYELLDNPELALKLIEIISNTYSDFLCARYKLSTISELTPLEVYEAIGKKRGCIISGGEIDYERVGNIILDEFRKGMIGKISLESPKG